MYSPILFFAFANNQDAHLPCLEQEQKETAEALRTIRDNGSVKVETCFSTKVEDVFSSFRNYAGQIAIFHFSGHASGYSLEMKGETAFAGGLADLLKNQKGVELVFLNGCSTQGQVEALLKAGIPAVIATEVPIQDDKAALFAKVFYEAISQNHSITEAFEHASSFLKTKSNQETVIYRDLSWEGSEPEVPNDMPWALFLNGGERAGQWKVRRTFNEWLTKKLIYALQGYSKPAEKFLAKAESVSKDWETQQRISDKAKDIIAYSYVGVVGVQLRKLMAIGKEEDSSNKMKKYIENSIITAKRAMQLLCFTMLSKLWDQQREKKTAFTEEEAKAVDDFFDNNFEHDLPFYMHLLDKLYDIFNDNGLPFPLPEEKNDLDRCQQPDSVLINACNALQEMQSILNDGAYNLQACFRAEYELTLVLDELKFLARYKMVSIKAISYDEMRNAQPRYLHHYAALGIDSKFNVNADRVNYTEQPISTDAVLLYKGRYHDSINLFPFVIDYNALTFEQGAKICFFDHRKLEDGSLNFRFLENGTLENIEMKKPEEAAENLNDLMADQEKRKQHKLNSLFLQFMEAREAILGAKAEEESFDDLFEDEDF